MYGTDERCLYERCLQADHGPVCFVGVYVADVSIVRVQQDPRYVCIHLHKVSVYPSACMDTYSTSMYVYVNVRVRVRARACARARAHTHTHIHQP